MKMFRDAFRGFIISFKNEKNIKIHTCLAVVAVIVGIVLRLNIGLILLIIGSVLSTEMLNTSIESLCDLVNPDESEKVRNIKDIAAGAVLINAVISLLVGVYLYLQSIDL